jgi:hypothetical protein
MTVISTLKATPDQSTVSWRDGKRQIRAALKAAGVKAVGTFRPRKENRGEYVLSVEGGSVRARRRVGGEIVVQKAQMIDVSTLSAKQLAAILAVG